MKQIYYWPYVKWIKVIIYCLCKYNTMAIALRRYNADWITHAASNMAVKTNTKVYTHRASASWDSTCACSCVCRILQDITWTLSCIFLVVFLIELRIYRWKHHLPKGQGHLAWLISYHSAHLCKLLMYKLLMYVNY